MKEIVYTFDNRGYYLPDKKAIFENEADLKLIIKPHKFELKLSGDVLRSSFCKGYIIQTSCNGKVSFFDNDNNLLATTNETDAKFAQVEFSFNQNKLCLSFGREKTVDHYPNCDGEYDRFETKWVSEYEVCFDTVTNQAKA